MCVCLYPNARLPMQNQITKTNNKPSAPCTSAYSVHTMVVGAWRFSIESTWQKSRKQTKHKTKINRMRMNFQCLRFPPCAQSNIVDYFRFFVFCLRFDPNWMPSNNNWVRRQSIVNHLQVLPSPTSKHWMPWLWQIMFANCSVPSLSHVCVVHIWFVCVLDVADVHLLLFIVDRNWHSSSALYSLHCLHTGDISIF